jgi:hypothetical protein
MRTNPRVVLLAAAVTLLVWAGCGGGAGVQGGVPATGGELCLPDNSVCIEVPSGALAADDVLRIAPSSDQPGGALSPSYDISSTQHASLVFLKPATVSFALDSVDADVPNETLLRVYTREDGGDWVPLDNAIVDRVQLRIRGDTSHLSPFVVLRADRLPDGGIPIQIDGGPRDSGHIEPPFDASSIYDAGRPDAGTPDAGTPDAGPPDAGPPDAGPVDSGVPDAGPVDSGVPDSGVPDAGVPDAGVPDAGQPDAAVADAGVDAGPDDAGLPDAGDGG